MRVQDKGYYGYISIKKTFGYALGYEAKSRELCMPILGFQKKVLTGSTVLNLPEVTQFAVAASGQDSG